jgi:rhodanese-related sulfurtransferase
MATNVKQLIDAANAAVPRITPAEAREMIAKDNTLVVDVRDAPELEKSGKVAGAVHHSRGMLEFRADPASPYYDKKFETAQTIIVYCAAGALRLRVRCSRIWAMAKSLIWAPLRIGPRAAVQSTNRSTWA